MLTKRIIPCLDIKAGRTVKGVNFEGLRDAGDPVELAERYAAEGADELVFLDITATNEKRSTLLELVSNVAAKIDIPFTVGGGISSVEGVEQLLAAGADKVSINTAAFKTPNLIKECSLRFGSQCIVVAIDAKKINDKSYVCLNGGRVETTVEVVDWARMVASLGAGEILLTSMDCDGVKSGFENELTRAISGAVNIPVIASGGAGNSSHFKEVFITGCADAALAASIFHFREVEIIELKKYLRNNKINVRM